MTGASLLELPEERRRVGCLGHAASGWEFDHRINQNRSAIRYRGRNIHGRATAKRWKDGRRNMLKRIFWFCV
ncbi:MAG: hypothetical protein OET79_10035, partial [Nitrospirota bacterium]|nr:hypothetical protein [Nitrospirota bacterium]